MELVIDIRADVQEARRTLLGIEEKVLPQATATTINKTLTGARTFIRRELSRQTGLRQKSISDRLKLRRATARSLSGQIEIYQYRWPNIASFSGRQLKKGVKSKAWGKWKLYPGSFLINEGRVAVIRISRNRKPLKKLWGPSIVRVFGQTDVQAASKRYARERFGVVFKQEIRYRLMKLRGQIQRR